MALYDTQHAERGCGDRERAAGCSERTREASRTQNAADSSVERQCGIKPDVTLFPLFTVRWVVHMQSETFRSLRTRRFKSVYNMVHVIFRQEFKETNEMYRSTRVDGR